jgi:hypothetical protein
MNAVREQIIQHGYAVVWSEVLGEHILVTGSEGKEILVPDKYQDAVLYTLLELHHLDRFQVITLITPELLRTVHNVKRCFGGTIVGARKRNGSAGH